jgi:hypothetical protein
LFEVRRADSEAFARELERRGRARATVARPCTVTSFYRYAEEDGCWPTRRLFMYADLVSTTSRTRPG